MNALKVRIDHINAKLPKKAHNTDAGWDLFAVEDFVVPSGKHAFVPTGVTLEVPAGYFYEIHPRSSMKLKDVKEVPGIIDNGYRGPCDVLLRNYTDSDYHIQAGDKIGQIIIRQMEDVGWGIDIVKELSPTLRGTGGFGSTGK